MTRGAVAVIDDEPDLCRAAAEWLDVSGFSVTTFTDPRRAMRELDTTNCDCVLTDLRMPGASGTDVLKHFQASDPNLPVVLLTGHGDVIAAVAAMREGAYDFIEKPYDADHIVVVLDRAVERRRLARELARLRAGADNAALDDRLVGDSAAMVQLRRDVERLAPIDVDILLHGETGTGKEVVARALHDLGPRGKGPFVAINCAAIPETMFESEIFGHARGAFTGAQTERVGRFEHANGGTVLLDEIESMPLSLQAKVLRAIQERTVEPLGGNRSRPLDVRFIAASKADLREESAAGRFRADLYFRFATVELNLPPLRQRKDDIRQLYRRFTAEAAQRFGLPVPKADDRTLETLLRQDWPGNVRELKAAADRAVLGHKAGRTGGAGQAASSLSERVARFEAEAIAEALEQAGGSASAAAIALGLPRRTLSEKIARYRLRDGEAEIRPDAADPGGILPA